MLRKLPSLQKIDRLYWLEEWTQAKIAKKYKCNPRTVAHFMKRHKMKTRGRKRRKVAECVVSGCEALTCRVKRWRKGEFYFVWTIRCAPHHHENIRRMNREWKRRRRKSSQRRECPHMGKPLGKLSTIARED